MTQHSTPKPHPWSDRRSREGEFPWRGVHPWATRRQAGAPSPHPAPSLFAPADTEAAGVRAPTPGEPDSGRSRPSVRRLGGGLLPMPEIVAVDPRSAILTDPEVPEDKRVCWHCEQPVGRASTGGPGRVEGECASCGSPFNFRPALEPGELVAGQYEVRGCLAHGGQGWIYLAVDRNVSDRWVVLKGLQNPLDFEAHVVALAERQFLSEMAYPGIVKIHNFVRHRSGREVDDGYIVMEYVGGSSLKRMLDARLPERIPVAEAIGYLMEVLPALDYLHSFGLAYNDLKPDNIMVTEDEVKLIDLGAVAAIESYGSIYGTPGYMAPEVTTTGPTVRSDIYTVGRTLAVLTLDLPLDAELLSGDQHVHPALHRLLQRATAVDPARRFPSAYSMYCQLAGVLRMVLAADSRREHPQESTQFGSARGDFGAETLVGPLESMVDGLTRAPMPDAADIVSALPVPLIDGVDPSAELLASPLHAAPAEALETLRQNAARIHAGTITVPPSYQLEATFIAVRAELDLGAVESALALLDRLPPESTHDDWRCAWFRGIAALLKGEYRSAHTFFDTVYGMLPGEIPAALAVAATAELLVHTDPPEDSEDWQQVARSHYELVWRTDRGMVSAAFGLARRCAAVGEITTAVTVLDEVPEAARRYGLARISGALLLVTRPPEELVAADLTEAAARARGSDPRVPALRVVVVGAAQAWLRGGGRPVGAEITVLGFPCTETGLRGGLESSLRGLARVTQNRWQRYQLVDLANQVRPRTWF